MDSYQKFFKIIKLPSLNVNKKFLIELENFLLVDLPQKPNVKSANTKIVYNISLSDKFNSITYETIEHFKYDFFDNNLDKISINYSLKSDNSYYDIKLEFSGFKYSSEFIIRGYSNIIEDVISTIITGMSEIFKQNKTKNWIYHPTPPFDNLLNIFLLTLSILVVIGYFATKTLYLISHLFSPIIYFTSFYIWCQVYLKPFMVFDTKKQQKLNTYFSKIFWIFIAFIIGQLLFSYWNQIFK